MIIFRTVGQDPTVNFGVQRLDAATEHFGAARHRCNIDVVDACFVKRCGGIAARDQFHLELGQTLGKGNQPSLVVHAQ